VQIADVSARGDEILIALDRATAGARVHVWATRYVEPYEPWRRLEAGDDPGVSAIGIDRQSSVYSVGRDIGDEYRYILARRDAAKFPGNMRRRPSLLLNPWSPDDATTVSMRRVTGAGGRGGGPNSRSGGGGAADRADRPTRRACRAATMPNLDFLDANAPILANLRADSSGVVRVRRSDLGPGQIVHAVAIDRGALAYASLALKEKPRELRDRRLARGLDEKAHFVQQRSIEFVDGGGTAVIDDPATARTQAVGSLADVFALYRTLSGNQDLDTFAFLLRWPETPDEQKRALYSEHACHELHFFLRRKDPAFFASVVRPFLENKMDKTFLDEWLLDRDLEHFLEPWAFGRFEPRRAHSPAAALPRGARERQPDGARGARTDPARSRARRPHLRCIARARRARRDAREVQGRPRRREVESASVRRARERGRAVRGEQARGAGRESRAPRRGQGQGQGRRGRRRRRVLPRSRGRRPRAPQELARVVAPARGHEAIRRARLVASPSLRRARRHDPGQRVLA
jgi:hypothetical protein